MSLETIVNGIGAVPAAFGGGAEAAHEITVKEPTLNPATADFVAELRKMLNRTLEIINTENSETLVNDAVIKISENISVIDNTSIKTGYYDPKNNKATLPKITPTDPDDEFWKIAMAVKKQRHLQNQPKPGIIAGFLNKNMKNLGNQFVKVYGKWFPKQNKDLAFVTSSESASTSKENASEAIRLDIHLNLDALSHFVLTADSTKQFNQLKSELESGPITPEQIKKVKEFLKGCITKDWKDIKANEKTRHAFITFLNATTGSDFDEKLSSYEWNNSKAEVSRVLAIHETPDNNIAHAILELQIRKRYDISPSVEIPIFSSKDAYTNFLHANEGNNPNDDIRVDGMFGSQSRGIMRGKLDAMSKEEFLNAFPDLFIIQTKEIIVTANKDEKSEVSNNSSTHPFSKIDTEFEFDPTMKGYLKEKGRNKSPLQFSEIDYTKYEKGEITKKDQKVYEKHEVVDANIKEFSRVGKTNEVKNVPQEMLPALNGAAPFIEEIEFGSSDDNRGQIIKLKTVPFGSKEEQKEGMDKILKLLPANTFPSEFPTENVIQFEFGPHSKKFTKHPRYNQTEGESFITDMSVGMGTRVDIHKKEFLHLENINGIIIAPETYDGYNHFENGTLHGGKLSDLDFGFKKIRGPKELEKDIQKLGRIIEYFDIQFDHTGKTIKVITNPNKTLINDKDAPVKETELIVEKLLPKEFKKFFPEDLNTVRYIEFIESYTGRPEDKQFMLSYTLKPIGAPAGYVQTRGLFILDMNDAGNLLSLEVAGDGMMTKENKERIISTLPKDIAEVLTRLDLPLGAIEFNGYNNKPQISLNFKQPENKSEEHKIIIDFTDEKNAALVEALYKINGDQVNKFTYKYKGIDQFGDFIGKQENFRERYKEAKRIDAITSSSDVFVQNPTSAEDLKDVPSDIVKNIPDSLISQIKEFTYKKGDDKNKEKITLTLKNENSNDLSIDFGNAKNPNSFIRAISEVNGETIDLKTLYKFKGIKKNGDFEAREKFDKEAYKKTKKNEDFKQKNNERKEKRKADNKYRKEQKRIEIDRKRHLNEFKH